MADWVKPTEVDKVDLAFPARGPELTPDYDEVPDRFKSNSDPWVAFINRLFGNSVDQETIQFGQMDEVDGEMAWRHLCVVLGTYGTKHEHKVAGAAYLCSLWFTGVIYKLKTGETIALPEENPDGR